MEIKKHKHLSLKNINIKGGLWGSMQNLVESTVIPYQIDILNDRVPGVEKSHAIDNFRIAAGEMEGGFYGMVFQDSDVAKWLETVAYSLAVNPNRELETVADKVIAIIEKAQQQDGYLNTFFTVKRPEDRWKNLKDNHELYCAGHMMEAAIAYYQSTGKDKLLHVMKRMADHIFDRFIKEKRRGIPGHQEIELALMKLSRLTKEKRYQDLAQHFLDERGQEPDYFLEELAVNRPNEKPEDHYDKYYAQSHAPVREQSTAEGHSVRAMYMYTAMADLAGTTGEKELLYACGRIWDNIVERRMYVTGGIGSNASGEAFTKDFDLPNDTAYAETCASIGLVMFADRMLQITPDRKYADIMELALYNGVLSGMQQDGKRFFYVNPLEVKPGISGEIAGYKHVCVQRPGWHVCACCPPNITRLIMSIGKYAWGISSDTIYSHLYISGSTRLDIGEGVVLNTHTSYPWDSKVIYQIRTSRTTKFSLAIRIPEWCENSTITINGKETKAYALDKGYAYIKRIWDDKDTVELNLEMKPRRLYANSNIRADSGCVCLSFGPIVYCFEEEDNGSLLHSIKIPRTEQVDIVKGEGIFKDIPLLRVNGYRYKTNGRLYSDEPPKEESAQFTAVPYYLWANRGFGEMRVWIRES